jgi:hypothetical protein
VENPLLLLEKRLKLFKAKIYAKFDVEDPQLQLLIPGATFICGAEQNGEKLCYW